MILPLVWDTEHTKAVEKAGNLANPEVDLLAPTDMPSKRVEEVPIGMVDVLENTITTRDKNYLIHCNNVGIMKQRRKLHCSMCLQKDSGIFCAGICCNGRNCDVFLASYVYGRIMKILKKNDSVQTDYTIEYNIDGNNQAPYVCRRA